MVCKINLDWNRTNFSSKQHIMVCKMSKRRVNCMVGVLSARPVGRNYSLCCINCNPLSTERHKHRKLTHSASLQMATSPFSLTTENGLHPATTTSSTTPIVTNSLVTTSIATAPVVTPPMVTAENRNSLISHYSHSMADMPSISQVRGQNV